MPIKTFGQTQQFQLVEGFPVTSWQFYQIENEIYKTLQFSPQISEIEIQVGDKTLKIVGRSKISAFLDNMYNSVSGEYEQHADSYQHMSYYQPYSFTT
jgi:hypothetical protein